MATPKIIILKYRTYANGKHPINLQVSHKSKSITRSTGYTASVDEWDNATRRFTSEAKNFEKRNKTLQDLEEQANRIIADIEKENQEFSFETFLERFKMF